MSVSLRLRYAYASPTLRLTYRTVILTSEMLKTVQFLVQSVQYALRIVQEVQGATRQPLNP